jgi:hypothetical protein
MGFAQKIIGYVTGTGVEVDANNQLLVGLPNTLASTGKIRNMSENDDGTLTGTVRCLSPETDSDYRMRVSQDTLLEDELFNYTTQNTNKHTVVAAATNLVPSWTAGGYNSNPTGVIATTSGACLQSYKQFSLISTGTLSVDMEMSFSALPTSNTIIDFGLFLGGATNPFAPTDGAYFRLTSAGLTGVANYNGSETFCTITPFPLLGGTGTWVYTPNKKYQFVLYVTARDVQFWINDGSGALLAGIIPCPSGQGSMYLAMSQPFRIRHAIAGGAAGVALNAILSRMSVRLGGVSMTDNLGTFSSRALGAYEGLAGGTVGQLVAGTVTSGTLVKPTAAVPANASLTANLPGSLGGRIWEALTGGLAVNTDGIFAQYQVPVGSATVQGRRLKILGLKLSAFVQTVVAGGTACHTEFYIAVGATNTNLNTAESSIAKAPRRIFCPGLTQTMTGTQAVDTPIAQRSYYEDFSDAPIYANPGEFVSLVGNKTGTTVPTSGVIAHSYQFVYQWE